MLPVDLLGWLPNALSMFYCLFFTLYCYLLFFHYGVVSGVFIWGWSKIARKKVKSFDCDSSLNSSVLDTSTTNSSITSLSLLNVSATDNALFKVISCMPVVLSFTLCFTLQTSLGQFLFSEDSNSLKSLIKDSETHVLAFEEFTEDAVL